LEHHASSQRSSATSPRLAVSRRRTAWLDDANFQDGIIEFDVAASAAPGFHGLAFRAADHDNFEEVYLRSHLSEKPTPPVHAVFNGLWDGRSIPDRASRRRSRSFRSLGSRSGGCARTAARAFRRRQDVVFPQMIRPPRRVRSGSTFPDAAHFANFVMKRARILRPRAAMARRPWPACGRRRTLARLDDVRREAARFARRSRSATWRDLTWTRWSRARRDRQSGHVAQARRRSQYGFRRHHAACR